MVKVVVTFDDEPRSLNWLEQINKIFRGKHMNKSFFAALAAMIFTPAVAMGGWVSGGGALSSDDNNPWFIANTPTAEYCIEVADVGFPYDADTVDQYVVNAFSYWQKQFKDTYPTYEKARVGTQRFRRTECGADTPLKFQFGFLTEDQIKQIPTFKNYISLAIRTEYDRVNLRGKGFIYVAAESGRFKPGSDKLINNPWRDCDGCRLQKILLHELGHVFGLAHASDETNLMSDMYPELILRKFGIFNGAPTANYFKHPMEFSFRQCEFGAAPEQFAIVRKFFSIPAHHKCVGLRGLATGKFEILSAPDEHADLSNVLGVIDNTQSQSKLRNVSKLHVTDKQAVLPKDGLFGIPVSYVFHTSVTGTYFPVDRSKPKRAVGLQFEPNKVELEGVMDVEFISPMLWMYKSTKRTN